MSNILVFVTSPCETHMQAALHIVRYLKGTSNIGLFYSSTSTFDTAAYCDSDWASCPQTRRSLSRYYILLGSNAISWKAKKQTTVARSSCEAEYCSMANTVCELLWITYLLKDFHISRLLSHCGGIINLPSKLLQTLSITNVQSILR